MRKPLFLTPSGHPPGRPQDMGIMEPGHQKYLTPDGRLHAGHIPPRTAGMGPPWKPTYLDDAPAAFCKTSQGYLLRDAESLTKLGPKFPFSSFGRRFFFVRVVVQMEPWSLVVQRPRSQGTGRLVHGGEVSEAPIWAPGGPR